MGRRYGNELLTRTTSTPLRLFVAAYPPAEVAAAARAAAVSALAAWTDDGAPPPHRLTPVAQVHLTLLFVGPTPRGALDDVRESIARAVSGLPSLVLRPGALITLPARGPARLIALSLDGPPALLELQRRLAARLARTPRRGSSRPYLPHLTLCRFRSPVRRRPARSTPPVRQDEPLTLPSFPVDAIALMHSRLRPEGAEHVEVDRFTLGKP